MTKKVWKFKLEDGEHSVELEYSRFPGKCVLTLDGRVLERSSKLCGTGEEHNFMINGHKCVVSIIVKGLSCEYAFTIDGVSKE